MPEIRVVGTPFIKAPLKGGTMKKVVDLEKKIKDRQKKEQLDRHRGSAENLRKIIQCSSCPYRCAMCGFQADRTQLPDNPRVDAFGLMLCDNCRAEFEEFQAIKSGAKRADVLWHNKEWQQLWFSWLEYRKAINAFIASPGFKALVEETDSHR